MDRGDAPWLWPKKWYALQSSTVSHSGKAVSPQRSWCLGSKAGPRRRHSLTRFCALNLVFCSQLLRPPAHSWILAYVPRKNIAHFSHNLTSFPMMGINPKLVYFPLAHGNRKIHGSIHVPTDTMTISESTSVRCLSTHPLTQRKIIFFPLFWRIKLSGNKTKLRLNSTYRDVQVLSL